MRGPFTWPEKERSGWTAEHARSGPRVASGTKHAFGDIGSCLGLRPKSAFARKPFACFVCCRWSTLGSNAVLREHAPQRAARQWRASRGQTPRGAGRYGVGRQR